MNKAWIRLVADKHFKLNKAVCMKRRTIWTQSVLAVFFFSEIPQGCHGSIWGCPYAYIYIFSEEADIVFKILNEAFCIFVCHSHCSRSTSICYKRPRLFHQQYVWPVLNVKLVLVSFLCVSTSVWTVHMFRLVPSNISRHWLSSSSCVNECKCV